MESSRFSAILGDRSLFPELQARAYLNHSAISPPSLAVQAAATEAIARYASDGVGAFKHFQEVRALLRQEVAQLIGTGASDIAFVPNTSSGILAVALCFPWETGDKIVCFTGEFPTNVTPWQRAADLYGLELEFQDAWTFLEDAELGLERLEASLARGVRMVAVSAVQFQSGLRMPIEAMSSLCHRYGAKICVDGIQACGVVPVDVEEQGIDFMSVGSHKWLMGLEGCAFLYARAELQASLRPVTASWLSHEESLKFLFEGAGHLRYDRPVRKTIDFLEFGAQNTTGQLALRASLALIQQIGVSAIFEHVQAYNDALEVGFLGRGFTSLRTRRMEGRSGTLSVKAPESMDGAAVVRGLNLRGVACTGPDGLLRFAPHWPNAIDEVPWVLDVLDDTLRELGR
jgi:cysteine desulfurase/selenocysteine lyase